MKKFTTCAAAAILLALSTTNIHANTIKGLFADNYGSSIKIVRFYDAFGTWYEIDSPTDANFENELVNLLASFNNVWDISLGCCLGYGIQGNAIPTSIGVTRP